MEKRRALVIMVALAFVVLNPTTKANLVVMWNDTQANIPSGWTCISCNQICTQDGFECGLYQAYPKINNAFSGDGHVGGGANTHTHTITGVSNRGNVYVNPTNAPANSFNAASLTHTHGVNVSTSLSNTTTPPSYSLLYIIWQSSTMPQKLVPNMIVFYNSTTAPTNFSLFTDGDGYFPYGNVTNKQTIGQETHVHLNQSMKTAGSSGAGAYQTGLKANVPNIGHTHTLGSGSYGWDNQTHIPLYVNLTPIYVTQNTSIPVGMIGMFNKTMTGNWTAWTSLYGYYVRMSTTSFNVTGGESYHNHTAQKEIPTGAAPAGTNYLFGTSNASSVGHSHLENISVSNVNNNPRYSNFTFYISNGSQQVATDTCTTGLTDGLFNCNDNCIVTSPFVVSTLSLFGSGTFTLMADIYAGKLIKAITCRMINKNADGNELIITNG